MISPGPFVDYRLVTVGDAVQPLVTQDGAALSRARSRSLAPMMKPRLAAPDRRRARRCGYGMRAALPNIDLHNSKNKLRGLARPEFYLWRRM